MKLACRESEIVGNARITMVESSDPMSVPSIRTDMMIFCFVSMCTQMYGLRDPLMYLSKRYQGIPAAFNRPILHGAGTTP